MARPTAAVLTISDGVSAGTRDDGSGDAAQELLAGAGFDVATRQVVPDARAEIERALVRLAASHTLVVTTGGTGFGPRQATTGHGACVATAKAVEPTNSAPTGETCELPTTIMRAVRPCCSSASSAGTFMASVVTARSGFRERTATAASRRYASAKSRW